MSELKATYECIGQGCTERFSYTFEDDNWGSIIHHCVECGTFNLAICPANTAYVVEVLEVEPDGKA